VDDLGARLGLGLHRVRRRLEAVLELLGIQLLLPPLVFLEPI
jgi:hypothetical protein